MTREEAMYFGEIWLELEKDLKGSNTYEFFKIATQVLKQKPCEDCVSRQAVLDALEKWWNCKSENDDIYEIIKVMPPVTPAENLSKCMAQDVLNHWIGAEVLDKIQAELYANAELHEDGYYYLREEWIGKIFDKYKPRK